MNGYDLEESRIIAAINKKKCKRVLLQLPEGLKTEAQRLVNILQEKTKANIFVSGMACWGACDLPLDEARALSADLLVHFGHAPFHQPDFPILYVEARYHTDITPFIKKNIATFKQFKHIALVASVQHIHQIPIVKNLLEKEGIKISVPEGKGRAFHEGQVLGCEYSGAKILEKNIDAYIALSNQFHSLGLVLSTEKKVLLVDPVHKEIRDLQKLRNKMILQRAEIIERAKKARTFGVLLSLKSGQINTIVAENIKKKLLQHNKEVVMITMREFQPDELLNFGNIDAFVDTACPRVAIEDQPRYSKPILTIKELLVVLGEVLWEESLRTGFITAPYSAK
ncbi:MAG: diphthamide biosynthesis enzyme Dph2 [Nanoarchaeota archaeon]